MKCKRIGGFLPLIIAIAALVLAACSSVPEDSAAPAASEPAAQSTSQPAEAPASSAPASSEPAESAAQPEPVAEDAPIGASLIGELEGPSVITDPSMFPTTYNEAPQFAELVEQGKLPPVEERIGQDPLVIEPLDEVGQYGGIWRRGFSGPADQWNGYRCCSGPDHPLFWDYTGREVVPNILRDWEVSDDGTTFTFFLRRGMKWSDGHPFTSDDFLFWYESVYQNEELVPVPPSYFTINGKPGVMEKVDDTTFKVTFEEPYYLFPEVLAGATQLGGHAHQGREALGFFAPAHYMEQFLPEFAGQAAVDKIAQDEGYDNWVNLFKAKNDWTLNPDLPAVTPWVTVSPATETTWVLERNPYSIWVDSAGNQLPYIDKVVLTLFENLEVHNLRAVAGEYDMQARHIDIQKVPVFLENEEKGNYKLYLDPGDYGSDMQIKINKSFVDDPELGELYRNVDFRRALSMGVDREQISETFFLGIAPPRSVAPVANNDCYPGEKYETLWHTYDPAQANELLDSLGYTEKDANGIRLRKDGKGPLTLEVITYGGQFVQYTQIMEVVAQQWKDIGINLNVREVERSLGEQMFQANQHQMFAWNNDGSEHIFTFPGHVFPFDNQSSGGAQYGLWFQTSGAEGMEPPDYLKKVMDNWRKGFGVPREERQQLCKEIWQLLVDNVNNIGVVGPGPASMGVRIVKNDMGNIPSRMYNSPDGKTPSISRTMTFYWKSEENRQPQPLSIAK